MRTTFWYPALLLRALEPTVLLAIAVRTGDHRPAAPVHTVFAHADLSPVTDLGDHNQTFLPPHSVRFSKLTSPILLS